MCFEANFECQLLVQGPNIMSLVAWIDDFFVTSNIFNMQEMHKKHSIKAFEYKLGQEQKLCCVI